MSKRVKKPKLPQTKEERILARPKVACGTYPGQNRARRFRDRKKEARRKACRGRVQHD